MGPVPGGLKVSPKAADEELYLAISTLQNQKENLDKHPGKSNIHRNN